MLKSTPILLSDAIPAYLSKATTNLFEKYDVLTAREQEPRVNVYWEQYAGTIQVEAKLTLEIARTQILPAAYRYQSELADTLLKLKELGQTPSLEVLGQITVETDGLQSALKTLEEHLQNHIDELHKEANHCCKVVLPAMNQVREHADRLEELVADDYWPLPTYQEMLFIK